MLANREQNLSPVALALADDLRSGRSVGRAELGGHAVVAIAGRTMRSVSLTADGRRRKGSRKDGKLFFKVPADASLALGW